MYGDGVRIRRAANGYTVEMRDPKIVEYNAKRDYSSKNPKPYMDPEKTYIFADMAALTKFLTDNLDKALPADDYDSTFSGLTDDD